MATIGLIGTFSLTEIFLRAWPMLRASASDQLLVAAYAGLAKAGAMAAASGAEASALRQGLKGVFRLGLARGFRSPNMAKYATDEALREAAGRTNALVNAIGLDFAIGGAIDAATRKCGCEQP